MAASLSAPFMLAVHQIDLGAEMLLQLGEALLGGGEIARLGFLDQRADPIDPLAFVERAADRLDHLVEPVERNGAGVDRLAAGRLFAQLARFPCRRNRSAPACAGSASRSAPACPTASPLRASARR